MPSAEEVFRHHLEVFGAGDIEQILSDYTDDSVVMYEDRVARGRAEIREFFLHWITDLLPPGCRFDLDRLEATEDLVWITWAAESEKWLFEFGTNTFWIPDGKILRQTVVAQVRAK